jgi:hypothetical protein
MATTFYNYQQGSIGTTNYWMIDGAPDGGGNPTGYNDLDAGKKAIMVGCMICNRLTTSVEATVAVRNVATVVYLTKSLTIPAGDAIEIVQGKVVLEAGDEIQVSSNQAGAVDCVLSILKNA